MNFVSFISVPLGSPLGTHPMKCGVLGAAIGAGGSLLSSVVGGVLQSGQNRLARRFAREMWDKQTAYQDKVNAEERAYQDKVNAENRDWNTERNVRSRIEDAGYNPYLYNGGASTGMSVSDSVSLGGSPSAPSPTPLPTGFDSGALMSGIGSFASALSMIKDTEIKSYDFNRKQEVNKHLDSKTGLTGGFDVKKTLADLKSAESVANMQAAESSIMEIKAAFDQNQALDVNGVPMTDETGRVMTNLEARERNKLYKEFKEVDQLEQAILNAAKNGEILDWEKLTKKFNVEEMQPELLRQVKATVDQLNSQIRVNASQVAANYASANASNAAAKASTASASYTNALEKTENETRDGKVEAFEQENEARFIENSLKRLRELGVQLSSIRPKSIPEFVWLLSSDLGSSLRQFIGLSRTAYTKEVYDKLRGLSLAELNDVIDRFADYESQKQQRRSSRGKMSKQ